MLQEGETLRLLLGMISSLSLGISMPATRAEAPLAPEFQSLRVLKSTDENIDPKLKLWFDSVETLWNTKPNAAELLSNGSLSFAAKQLVSMDAGSFHKPGVMINELYDELLKNPQALVDDPLYPVLLYKLSKHSKTSEDNKKILENKVRHYEGKVCVKHKLVLDDIENLNPKRVSDDKLNQIISHIEREPVKKLQAKSAKELLRFFERNSEVKSAAQSDKLFKLFPYMIDDFPKLAKGTSDFDINFSRQQLKDIEIIEKAAKRGRCNKATRSLKTFITSDSSGEFFARVSSLSEDVDACYSRRGNRAKLKFWYGIKDQLKSSYGFIGEEFAEREKGLLYWNIDEFEKAKDIFRQLIDRSEKYPDLLARNLHTLARVYENEGDYKAAISNYARFIRQFPNDPTTNSTYTSLVLLNHLTDQVATAIFYAKELIDKESLKPYDDRDSGNIAFALFWYGSLNLSKGHYEKAFDYWRRLSQEYFSTFYGALGHYMLEQWFNKPLVFGAGQGNSFQPENYKETFSKQDQLVLKRIDELLRLGYKSEASCELSQLADNSAHYYDDLVKAMYHYKLGEWLQTVKLYASIPRSFRQTLAQGMERILFPRTFTEKIGAYAQRAGVEKELIYSITRQESVFNPIARSPVGASGLMQLMPATARVEARRLSKAYLQGARLQKSSRKRINLFDPETNIILGVHHVSSLFKRYEHPVYVLTSYNANPTATKKWIDNIQNDHMLNFVERIPYLETRGYVKLVMRNYFYYKRWYNTSSEPMPLLEYLVPKTVEMARRSTAKTNKFKLQ